MIVYHGKLKKLCVVKRYLVSRVYSSSCFNYSVKSVVSESQIQRHPKKNPETNPHSKTGMDRDRACREDRESFLLEKSGKKRT